MAPASSGGIDLNGLYEVAGCAGARRGEREIPGWSGEGVHTHTRRVVCRVAGSLRLGPDKNDIVGDCSAVEAVDAQADWSCREALAIDSPGGLDRSPESRCRGSETLVGEPERDRCDGDGDVDDDGLDRH